MKLQLLLVISAWFFNFSSAIADPNGTCDLAKAVIALDPSISEVSTGGIWGTDTAGIYRVVVMRSGEEHLFTSVFLQWLSYDSTNDREFAQKTIVVSELTDLPLIVVLDVRIDSIGDEGSQATFLLGNRYSNEKRECIVNLGLPGEYSFNDDRCLK